MEEKIWKSKKNLPVILISLLRIMVGLMFLTTWFSNVRKGFYTSDGLLEFFTNVFPQSENPLVWYAGFIYNVIMD